MDNADAILARLAARHHGAVSHAHALANGATTEQLDYRRLTGVLVPVYRGVSRHAAVTDTRLTQLSAALLASGKGAVASHRSAAELWRLQGVPRFRPEVTVMGTALPLGVGVLVHRTKLLEAADVAVVDRIPVTSLPRTLLDLGAVLPHSIVVRAAEHALLDRMVSEVDLICVLERVGRKGRRGTATLRSIVEAHVPPAALESRLELDLLRLIRSCGLAEPLLQHEVACVDGRKVRLDFAWPDLRLAVEADGRRWHSTSADFERDLARGRSIVTSGWSLLRYGWNDVHHRRWAVVAELRRALTNAA